MAHLTLSGRVYLDTNIFIYALEGYPTFRAVLTTLFAALDRGDLVAVTSELTLAEALVKPLLDHHARAASCLFAGPATLHILAHGAGQPRGLDCGRSPSR